MAIAAARQCPKAARTEYAEITAKSLEVVSDWSYNFLSLSDK